MFRFHTLAQRFPFSSRHATIVASASASLLLAGATLLACSSKGDSGPETPTETGGPVVGVADTHCALPDGGVTVQPTSANACDVPLPDGDAGAELHDHNYPTPLFNSEGDDDDCKYHVRWSAGSITEGTDIYFIMTAVKKTDGSAVTGAHPISEVYLNDDHPAPVTDTTTTESVPGTYTIGPIRFDRPGDWTFRYHFFEECSEVSDETPHSHVAFYVRVP